jgi:hypothetical protein
MTKTRFLPGLGLGLIVSATVVSAALAGPWVTTNWKNTNLSQEECLEQAGRAIRAGGFEPLQSSQYSRFGGLDEYTVSIRCISEKQMVFFLVAGPENAFTSKYLNAMLSNF